MNLCVFTLKQCIKPQMLLNHDLEAACNFARILTIYIHLNQHQFFANINDSTSHLCQIIKKTGTKLDRSQILQMLETSKVCDMSTKDCIYIHTYRNVLGHQYQKPIKKNSSVQSFGSAENNFVFKITWNWSKVTESLF